MTKTDHDYWQCAFGHSVDAQCNFCPEHGIARHVWTPPKEKRGRWQVGLAIALVLLIGVGNLAYFVAHGAM